MKEEKEKKNKGRERERKNRRWTQRCNPPRRENFNSLSLHHQGNEIYIYRREKEDEMKKQDRDRSTSFIPIKSIVFGNEDQKMKQKQKREEWNQRQREEKRNRRKGSGKRNRKGTKEEWANVQKQVMKMDCQNEWSSDRSPFSFFFSSLSSNERPGTKAYLDTQLKTPQEEGIQ